jgi:hypothetical protein
MPEGLRMVLVGEMQAAQAHQHLDIFLVLDQLQQQVSDFLPAVFRT